MTSNERKTITDPDAQLSGVVGIGDQVTGLRVLDSNTEFTIPQKARITVGAGADCDIVIAYPSVSSLHCVLERHERGILLIDQGSKNGTRRGRHRTEQFEVEDGVMIFLGTVCLMPFGAQSADTRRRVQQLVGYAERLQYDVDQVLRATRGRDHVLLISQPGSRGSELAKLIHEARGATGPFATLGDPDITPGQQVSLLKNAQDGSLFVHQSMLPADCSTLLQSLTTYRVKLFAATNDEPREPTVWGALYRTMQVLRVASIRDRASELVTIIQATLDELSTQQPAMISQRNFATLEQYTWLSMEELLKAITCAVALESHSSVRSAAKLIGVPKSTLSRRMKRYGLTR